MRARRGPVGRCTNRTPSQPRQPDAYFGQICVFRFPWKVSFLRPRNLRRSFPRRDTHRPGVCGRGSLASAGRSRLLVPNCYLLTD